MKTVEERFWAKVDKTDGCWKWTGYILPNGYGRFRLDSRVGNAHRVAYEMTFGTVPEGLVVDHTCHARYCVNPDHLRLVTNKQNGENRKGAPRHSKSGVRGVYLDKGTNKWRAGLSHDGRRIGAGLHATIEEAEAAVIAKRNELFTHNDLDRRDS